MKRILLSAFTFAAISIQAQVTITSADMFQNGQTYLTVQAFETDLEDPALSAGEDVLWDFSELTGSADIFLPYVSVSSVPFTYQLVYNNPNNPSYANRAMPISNLGVGVEVPVNDGYQFFRVDETGLYDCGLAGNVEGIPLIGNRNPTDRIFKFPLEYGMDADSSYSFAQVVIPELGYGNIQVWRENMVDAWGTVITPNGNYDAIRVRSVVNRTDTIVAEAFNINQVIVHPEVIEYKWMALDQGIPVLQINYSEGAVTQVLYRSDDDLSDVVQQVVQQVATYPNPAREYTTVRLPDQAQINGVYLSTVSGQVIQPEYRVNGNELTVQLNDLSAGMYRLNIKLNDSSLSSGWIVVQP